MLKTARKNLTVLTYSMERVRLEKPKGNQDTQRHQSIRFGEALGCVCFDHQRTRARARQGLLLVGGVATGSSLKRDRRNIGRGFADGSTTRDSQPRRETPQDTQGVRRVRLEPCKETTLNRLRQSREAERPRRKTLNPCLGRQGRVHNKFLDEHSVHAKNSISQTLTGLAAFSIVSQRCDNAFWRCTTMQSVKRNGYSLAQGLELIKWGRLACAAELLEVQHIHKRYLDAGGSSSGYRGSARLLELYDELAVWQTLGLELEQTKADLVAQLRPQEVTVSSEAIKVYFGGGQPC